MPSTSTEDLAIPDTPKHARAAKSARAVAQIIFSVQEMSFCDFIKLIDNAQTGVEGG